MNLLSEKNLFSFIIQSLSSLITKISLTQTQCGMQFRASLFAASLNSSNAFAIAKKIFFFILVYGRRSKMVNLCIVQFPGQSSNAIRVLLIFQPSTLFPMSQNLQFSSLSNAFSLFPAHRQIISGIIQKFHMPTSDWLDDMSEIKFLLSNDSLCCMRVHLTKKNCANRIRKLYLLYLPFYLQWW